MPNQWFRMYAEFADDPKVQIMPEHMQRRLAMLFCSRCKEEQLQDLERAFHWRITTAELAETKAIFVSQGFIDERWNVLNWNSRQYVSDSSTDRVRKYRQGLKQGETFHETPVTETVTAPEQIQNRTEHKNPLPNAPLPVDEEPTKKARTAKVKTEPTKSDIAASRHAEFKDAITKFWEWRNPGIEMQWDGMEGKSLGMYLASSPQTPVGQFKGFLKNRGNSDNVSQTERPGTWIRSITKYAAGPLDQYGKPKGAGHGKSNSATKQANTIAAGRAAVEAILGIDSGRVDEDRSFDGRGDQPGEDYIDGY